MLHIGVDADSGEIVAADLTTNDVDDAAQVGPLLDQLEGSEASFTVDGAYDQDGAYQTVMDRDPEALVIVPPRCTAVLSETIQTMPTQRDRHIQRIAEKGRMGWQKISGYNRRARVETAIGRYKRLMGDGLRFHQDERRATEVAVHVLNRMFDLGRPTSVRIASIRWGWGCCAPLGDPCNNAAGSLLLMRVELGPEPSLRVQPR